MNQAHLLARAARVFPFRPAVSRGVSVVADYRALAGNAARVAYALRHDLNLAAGDRVALCMTNSPEYLELLFGIWWAGLVAVPVNAKLHHKEVAYITAHSGSRLCFATPDLAQSLQSLPHDVEGLRRVMVVGTDEYHAMLGEQMLAVQDCESNALAWLFYTSGTTGRPKGVMITHANLMLASLCYFSDVDGIADGDCILHAAPMSHGSGLYSVAHVLRAANQIIPESGHFDPAEIFSLAHHWRGMALFAAPTMVHRLVALARRAAPPLEGLKSVIYGGGPMYLADIRAALEVMGNRFIQIYGQGECPMSITALSRAHLSDRAHPRWQARAASVGVAHSAVQVRVADSEDRALPAGEVGEILVRGDIVMAGYWANPEASAATLRSGWLHTGDVGVLDEDGFLTLKDRSKDLIISGGTNIYPREVEEVLLKHPDVSEVSVVGRTHPEWGEEVLAFVVRRPGTLVSEADLDALCLSEIARFKRPKAYRFIDVLPKNNYGKVLKTVLREALQTENREGDG